MSANLQCGNANQAKITGLKGKAHRPGVYQCNETACREQFTVTVGTVFERSKIPLTKWLAALFLMTASKKGTDPAMADQVQQFQIVPPLPLSRADLPQLDFANSSLPLWP